jgi:hypothetical protein
LIFDAHTERDVFKIGHPPQLTAQQVPESFVPLGEDLKNVPVSTSHDVADALDVVEWNVLVKKVAHRVDENLPWASPMQWLIEFFWNESKIEALLERVAWHTPEAFCENLCIAELAARAHLRAASHWIPRRVCPFNRRAIAHRGLV